MRYFAHYCFAVFRFARLRFVTNIFGAKCLIITAILLHFSHLAYFCYVISFLSHASDTFRLLRPPQLISDLYEQACSAAFEAALRWLSGCRAYCSPIHSHADIIHRASPALHRYLPFIVITMMTGRILRNFVSSFLSSFNY